MENNTDFKVTGVIRRIDDLGRIVIPKEFRRELKIHENDPLEIFYNKKDKMVGFSKYNPLDYFNIDKVIHVVNIFNIKYSVYGFFGEKKFTNCDFPEKLNDIATESIKQPIFRNPMDIEPIFTIVFPAGSDKDLVKTICKVLATMLEDEIL